MAVSGIGSITFADYGLITTEYTTHIQHYNPSSYFDICSKSMRINVFVLLRL